MLQRKFRPVLHRAVLFLALGAALCVVGPSDPLFGAALSDSSFVVRPDPPSASGDVDVVYAGSQPDRVEYRIGDGESHAAKIGKDGKFTIPKRLLKAGSRLYLRDGNSRHPGASLCVSIEP